MESTDTRRDALIQQVITDHTESHRMPRLWCPPITHYDAGGDAPGAIDVARTRAHWRTLVDHVGGFLTPGSTGDGWDMSAAEIHTLLQIATDLAVELNTLVLVGVLRTEVDAMRAVIEETVAWLTAETGEQDPLVALRARHVAGFTICPPKGAALSQAQIRVALESVLDLGLPMAIYQLPQVTGNEISTAVFQDLAARYPNFLLFKDTSGQDHVPLADRGESGVFLVRGAEGNYARWLRETGGPYQGLLLSTANCFAAELAEVIARLEAGRIAEARALSQRLTAVVEGAFAAVADLKTGNAFSNANKAMDHFMAYGPDAAEVAPPVCHGGVQLPSDLIVKIGALLEAHGLMPREGYL
jgi:dihydrodipicolinate synthase/N-acetylneuraminate lyase